LHPLKQYLRDLNEPIQDFANRVGASRQTLYRIIGGTQAPKPALARRIVDATGGAVSYEMLYSGRGAASAEVIGLFVEGKQPLLDHERVKVAIAIVVNHLTPPNNSNPQDVAVDIAAEAVVNTYAALATVTTRQGPDRLCQALRPVLAEILQENEGSPPPAGVLDRGAELGAQLYFQTLKFGRNSAKPT